MRLVIVESPFAGDVKRNLRYLRACLRDCLMRGEAPYASHGLYTQSDVLDDGSPLDRTLGIEAGFAWKRVADASVFYTDLGISRGMELGAKAAEERGQAVEFRSLGAGWDLVNYPTTWPEK